ncbi:MAG: CapA family protein [Thermodesulfovibrionales bacterium]
MTLAMEPYNLAPARKATVLCVLLLFLLVSPVNAEKCLSVTAVGDIMMGTDYPEALLPPDDGARIFDGVTNALHGSDLVIGNLEGPLTSALVGVKCQGKGIQCYEFRTPPHYALLLRDAGFSALNIANNHIADFGSEGVRDTVTALLYSGIQAVGGTAVASFSVEGSRVSVVGFSYLPRSDYSYPIEDMTAAQKVIRSLKEESDLVIASVHAGAEGEAAQHIPYAEEIYLGEKRGNVVEFARALIDAGADMVLGHGPHVLRAMEVYKGKLIAYSLGNFLVYERFNISGPSGVSAILKVRLSLENGDFIEGSLVPVIIRGRGLPQIDPRCAAIDLVRKLIEEDIEAPKLRISKGGELKLSDRAIGTRQCEP